MLSLYLLVVFGFSIDGELNSAQSLPLTHEACLALMKENWHGVHKHIPKPLIYDCLPLPGVEKKAT